MTRRSRTSAAVSRGARGVVKGAVWVGCLLPVVCLLYWYWTDDLTANPIDFVTDTLGEWALRLLLASLALTPLRIVTGMAWQMTLRRLLGLFAFFYVALHFGVWIGLDHFFAWGTWARTSSNARTSRWA